MSRNPSFLSAVRRKLAHMTAAVAVAAATTTLPTHAGGPLSLVNHQPVVYPNGGASITLNLDQGPLGARTNTQAAAIVQNAIGMWNSVSTSTMRLVIGAQLSTDYTASNYSAVYSSFSDGINPIIFDTDGSITDALLGVGAKSNVLGFAGSSYFTSGASAGKFREGRAVISGYLSVTDTTMTEVLAHEIGHFFGLDHSQLDNTQGLASSNYVLMYPIAYRTLSTLHEDDIAAVTSLYPTANVGAIYGQLTGTFTTVAGAPILGANIWAQEVATGKVYSIVSDYLTQGNGYFRLYLPAGTYTLNAESIASGFVGGSGVGPYSSSASGASFQPPHPITPVALGGGQQIRIVAGCLATATFRLDGSGGVSGNCSGSSPTSTATTVSSSNSAATVGSTVTLTAAVAGVAPTGTVNFTDGGTTIANCGAIALGGTGNSRTAVCATSALTVGVHSIVASYAGDSNNLASSSAALSQVITAAAGGGGTNVALASAGAVATASSSYGAGYPVTAINNNERAGASWGNGGGWADGTPGTFPDWVQITFNGSKTIDHVVVYTVQDNYASPVEPTDNMTFAVYGNTDFTVQGWSGSAWVVLGTVTGNNLVKRTVSFAPFTTDRIRINVTAARNVWSLITEVEAWGVNATTTQGDSNVALASAGAVASASSSYGPGYPIAAINNDERTGAGWGSGGGWADGTPGTFADWVQIDFNGSKTIDRVVVYTVQDNYAAPVEPTDTLTFNVYGNTDFTVQGWNGSSWVVLGTVSGNNLVKRTVTFAPFSTDRIRVNVTAAKSAWSLITEVEAWGTSP